VIGNFDVLEDQSTYNLWVFLEGDDFSVLESDVLEGELLDLNSPGRELGEVVLAYDPEASYAPGHRVEREGYQIEVTIDQSVYGKLEDNRIHHERFISSQNLPGNAKLWIFPADNRGRDSSDYSFMYSDLDFYSGLSDEKRETVRENLRE
jgi:hypothetical protein